MGSRGLMVESRTHKFASLNLGPAGIVIGGGGAVNVQLSPPSIP